MSIQMNEAMLVQPDRRYLAQVGEALDEVAARVAGAEAEEGAMTLNLATDRYIIFSDLHKGIRNNADDFQSVERAYNAALAYYFALGHTLVVLGDAEELWEERPSPVLESYRHTLRLEARFHQEGRYLRIWGNHDDEWQYENSVARLLAPLYGPPALQVREGVRLKVVDGSQEIGTLFLVHGHQGSNASDRFTRLARIPVRYLWRPIQRLIGFSFNTPATHWALREEHNIAMHAWATKQDNLILITGHTHRPVFESQTHADQIKEELAPLEEALQETPHDRQLRRDISLLSAKLEWVRAQNQQKPGNEGQGSHLKPCYFNTGCCCFVDGNMTGIEIANGDIRLVRWPNNQKRPQPLILESESLADIFTACCPPQRSPQAVLQNA